MTISRSVQIAAPARTVWDLVSDLPGMGRVSPENVGGSWRRGATGPAVGARFRGHNRNGWRRWSTTAQVIECEAGQAFAFDVSYLAIPVSRWSYAVQADGEGACTTTETWSDRRPGWFKGVAGIATGVRVRSDDTTAVHLERSLAALKALAERS